MTTTRPKARWRKDRYGHFNLRRAGHTLAYLYRFCDSLEWFGISNGSALSANVLREIARKVDLMNEKEAAK